MHESRGLLGIPALGRVRVLGTHLCRRLCCNKGSSDIAHSPPVEEHRVKKTLYMLLEQLTGLLLYMVDFHCHLVTPSVPWVPGSHNDLGSLAWRSKVRRMARSATRLMSSLDTPGFKLPFHIILYGLRNPPEYSMCKCTEDPSTAVDS
jgi:hypothetical protein